MLSSFIYTKMNKKKTKLIIQQIKLYSKRQNINNTFKCLSKKVIKKKVKKGIK